MGLNKGCCKVSISTLSCIGAGRQLQANLQMNACVCMCVGKHDPFLFRAKQRVQTDQAKENLPVYQTHKNVNVHMCISNACMNCTCMYTNPQTNAETRSSRTLLNCDEEIMPQCCLWRQRLPAHLFFYIFPCCCFPFPSFPVLRKRE